jgi:hypothetical protein
MYINKLYNYLHVSTTQLLRPSPYVEKSATWFFFLQPPSIKDICCLVWGGKRFGPDNTPWIDPAQCQHVSLLHHLQSPDGSHGFCSFTEFTEFTVTCVFVKCRTLIFSLVAFLQKRYSVAFWCRFLKSVSAYSLHHSWSYVKKLETFRLLFQARNSVKIVLLPVNCFSIYSQF